MSLSVNTNLLALTTQRSLGSAQAGLGTSLQRLSSGLRINSAKDDAAGLAISERFTSQIRGLNQAARNANDALSLLQTAEGAIAGVASTLQRIRELAVQAANGTNSAQDRQALQAEVAQLAAEIERTGRVTEFNGQQVFDQAQVSRVGDAALLAVFDGLTSVGSWLENAEQRILQYFGLQASGAKLDIRYTGFTDGAGGVAAYVQPQGGADGAGRFQDILLQVDMADFVPPNLPDGGSAPYYNDRIIAHEMVHAVMAATTNWIDLTTNALWFVEGTAEFIQGADERVAGDIANVGVAGIMAAFNNNGVSSTSEFYSAGYAAVRFMHDAIKGAGGAGIKDVMTYLQDNAGATLSTALANASSGRFASLGAFNAEFTADGADYINNVLVPQLNNGDTGAIGGLGADNGPALSATRIIPNAGTRSGLNVTDGFEETYEEIAKGGGVAPALAFQVGANAFQLIETRIGAMNLTALGLRDTLDLTNSPAQAIVAVDRALDYVNSERAVLGAQQSRMEYAVATLQLASEYQSSSRARIVDADFASETAGLIRQQILQEAGLAVTAQANLYPRLALDLLLI